jgi:polar amino acid transport system substrate-binding protein
MRASLRALLFFVAVGAAAAASARPLHDVQSSGVLRVSVYRDYKPWSWEENGKLKGVDVDIGAALAKALGVQVDYFLVRADDNINDDLRNGVWKGTVLGEQPGDVMLHVPNDSQIEADNDRVKLTAPYQMEGLALAVDPAKAGAAKDFALFEREKVAVDMQTLSDIILLSARDHKLIPNVVHVHGESKAAEAYDKGEVVAFYGEAAMVEALAHQTSRPVTIVYPQHPLAKTWPVGGAVKADSIDLADAIDKVVADLSKSGELKKIFASYGVSWRPPPQED